MSGYFTPQMYETFQEAASSAGDSARLLKPDDFYRRITDPDVIRTPESTVEAFSSTVAAEDYVMGKMFHARAGLVAVLGEIEASIDFVEEGIEFFGRNEAALHHFHSSFREKLGRPPLERVD